CREAPRPTISMGEAVSQARHRAGAQGMETTMLSRAEWIGILVFGLLGLILSLVFLEKRSAIALYTLAAAGIGLQIARYIESRGPPAGTSNSTFESRCLKCGAAARFTAV